MKLTTPLGIALILSPLQTPLIPVVDDVKFIFAFGDSYTSDGWNGYGDPLQPHWLSCSTAGPTWARELTDNMPRRARLINLAVSGASVDNRVVYTGVPDFRSQTFSFLNYIAPFPNEVPWNKDNSIFTVSFGTNDVAYSFKRAASNGTTIYSRDLDSYFATVDRLYAAGARRFLFNNVVPFDRALAGITQGPRLQAKLAESIVEFNNQLSAKADAYCASKTDIICSVYDTHLLFSYVMDNFRDFGFATPDGVCKSYAARSGCTVDPAVDPKCLGPVSAYVWKDGLHPTFAADKLWASGVFGQLFSSVVTEQTPYLA